MPATLPPKEDKPGVPMPPPLFFILPFLALLLLDLALPAPFVTDPLRWELGGALVLLGIAMAVWGYVVQMRAGTSPLPERPSTAIVTDGPYRFTRNPMYVGFALATLGGAFLANSLWTLIAVPVGIVLISHFVVAREERYLARKFGEEYLSYKRRVRRWL